MTDYTMVVNVYGNMKLRVSGPLVHILERNND